MKVWAFYIALFALVLLATIALAPVPIEKPALNRDQIIQTPWQDFNPLVKV